MMRRTFLQSLSAVAAAFALPWKGEAKDPPVTKLGGPSSMWDEDWDTSPPSEPMVYDYSTYRKFHGKFSHEWNDPRNWDGGIVAKSGDNVIIDCYPVGCVELPDGYSFNSLAIVSGSLSYNVRVRY